MAIEGKKRYAYLCMTDILLKSERGGSSVEYMKEDISRHLRAEVDEVEWVWEGRTFYKEGWIPDKELDPVNDRVYIWRLTGWVE
jgi:hypothetical protein